MSTSLRSPFASVWNNFAGLFGIVTLLAVAGLVVLALMGPAVGNVFSNITANIAYSPSVGYGSSSVSLANIPPEKLEARLIVREGELTLVVADPSAAQLQIEKMVAEMTAEGAFVVSSQADGSAQNQLPMVSMTLRVPAARFDEAMDQLAALAVTVQTRHETAQDVTDEYVDVQARLKSMRAARDRLAEIMRGAATTVDLLQAEQQLAAREVEIESLEGRLQYITDAARLSKISVTLRPSVLSQPVMLPWQPDETARRAGVLLLGSAQMAGKVLIYIGIVVLPWALVLGGVGWGVRRLLRRKITPHIPPGVEPSA